ncbi:MAG: heat-inducible transcriptional repressor HrcA [Fibrobacterota bacterium]
MEQNILTERESTILDTIVRDYVVMAEPEGSRAISRKSGLELSAATVRNVISDLAEKGFVEQLHTSAGRIPTDKGYRYYVDHLIELSELSNEEKDSIEKRYDLAAGSFEELAGITSRILSGLSRQLGLVLSPRLHNGVFRRLSIVEVAEHRLLLVLAVESGLINTIIVEVRTAFSSRELQAAAEFINSRLSGRMLEDIQAHLPEMMHTDDPEKIGVIRLFLDRFEDLSNFPVDKILHLSGASHILEQPEFGKKEDVEAVIELMENKEMLVHLLDKRKQREGVYITIGGENADGGFRSYSIVSSRYTIGGVPGAVGIIGPRRMPYPKLIPVVSYTAEVLAKRF